MSTVRTSLIKTRSRAQTIKNVSNTLSKINKAKSSTTKTSTPKSSTKITVVKQFSPLTTQDNTSLEDESFTSVTSHSMLDTPNIIPETQSSNFSPTLITTPVELSCVQPIDSRKKSLSSWNLTSYGKLQQKCDELQAENEMLITENMEIRASVQRKDEQLIKQDNELDLLRTELLSLTTKLDQQKKESDNLLHTIGLLSDDLRKRDELFLTKISHIESQLLNVSQPVTNSLQNSSQIEKTKKKKNTIKLTNETTSSLDSSNKVRKVLIIGDSHVRGLGDCLRQRIPSSIQVKTYCLPNGKLGNISQFLPDWTKDVAKEDTVFIIGGTNDITHPDQVPSLDFIPFQNLANKCNAIFGEIPYRFDKMNFNNTIYNTNCLMYSKTKNLKKIEFSTLNRNFYTRHGLHLNIKGKHSIARQMKSLLSQSVGFLC